MTPPSTDLLLRFFTEIGILDQLAGAELQRALGGALNRSEFSVLTHFTRREHAVTPSHLAKAFQMAKPSMTATLSKLEAKGFVSIRPAVTDRRRKYVQMTEAGRDAHAAAVARLAPLMARRLEGFDPSRLNDALPVLAELRAHLDAARNAADGITTSETPSNHE